MAGKHSNPRKVFPDRMCNKCGYWYAPISEDDSGICSHCETSNKGKSRYRETDHQFRLLVNFWNNLISEYTGDILETEMIYFFRGRETRKIKVGYTSTSPLHRLLECQVGSPDILEIIGVVHAPFCFERELHILLAPYHSHGEWFNGGVTLYKFIKRISYMPNVDEFRK